MLLVLYQLKKGLSIVIRAHAGGRDCRQIADARLRLLCYNDPGGMHVFTRMKSLLLERYPVRKTWKQKSAFIEYVKAYAEEMEMPVTVEEGGRYVRSRNVVLGDLKRARMLITAHYDTCARLPFSNFMTPNNWPIVILTEGILIALIAAAGVWLGGAAGDLMRAAAWPGWLAWMLGFALGVSVSAALLALMLIGPANPHNANDNTSGVTFVLGAMERLKARTDVAYVLFDNEEKGLLGASAFIAAHPQAARRCLVVNMDCIGDGSTLLYTGTKRAMAHPLAKKIEAALLDTASQYALFAVSGEFPKWLYPSDQMLFPRGTAFAALKGKRLLYLDRIHTARDTVLDEKNLACLLDVIEKSI